MNDICVQMAVRGPDQAVCDPRKFHLSSLSISFRLTRVWILQGATRPRTPPWCEKVIRRRPIFECEQGVVVRLRADVYLRDMAENFLNPTKYLSCQIA